MAEHPLAHTDRRPSHLLRFSKSQLCTNWKPDNPTSCHATCRLLHVSCDPSKVPCPANKLSAPCARGALCPFDCRTAGARHSSSSAALTAHLPPAAARVVPIVQVLLGERGLAPEPFGAAFQRLCGASLVQLTQLELVAFAAALPKLFVLAVDKGKPLVRNVRWPLPLDPSLPLPVVVAAAPPVAAAAPAPAAPLPTPVTAAAAAAPAPAAVAVPMPAEPFDASLASYNRLKREFEGVFTPGLPLAEVERQALRVVKAIMVKHAGQAVALTKLFNDFVTVTGKRIGALVNDRPNSWLQKQPEYAVVEIERFTHMVAFAGSPAEKELIRQRDEHHQHEQREQQKQQQQRLDASAAASNGAASSAPAVKKLAPPPGYLGPMPFETALDIVCDILGTKEMTSTAMAMQFMGRTKQSFSKATGMMPGVFLRSTAVEATKRIQVWKKENEWYCARRGNSVGPDTSIDNVRRKAISILVRLLNKDGGRSKLHHIANVFERETTHPLVSIFGPPLTRTLLENGRDAYFAIAGERVTLQPTYNEQHPRYDDNLRAALDIGALTPPASPRASSSSSAPRASPAPAPAAAAAAAVGAPTPVSVGDMATRTVMATPLPPPPPHLTSDDARCDAVSAQLQIACEVSFGKVEAASARVDANVAVVTFVDDQACARALAAGSVQVGGVNVSLMRMASTKPQPTVENVSLALARQAIESAQRASTSSSRVSIASMTDSIVPRNVATLQSSTTTASVASSAPTPTPIAPPPRVAAATTSAAAAANGGAPPGLLGSIGSVPAAPQAAAPQLSDINARLAQLAMGASTITPAGSEAPAAAAEPVDVNSINARLEGLLKSGAAAAAATAAAPGRSFGQSAVKPMTPLELAALRSMRAMVPAASERQCKLHLREHEWQAVPATLGLLNEMDDETRTCCICKTNEIEVQLVECRHACACRHCFKELVTAAKKKAKGPVECPLCREEIHNTISIKMPPKATANERKDVERIVTACANKPERLKPAQELAKGGYSLQTCILALLRNNGEAEKADIWLRDNCFAFVSADEAEIAASVAARAAAAAVQTPKGLEPTPAEQLALQERYKIKEFASWDAFSKSAGQQITKRQAVPQTRKTAAAAPAAVVASAPVAPLENSLPVAVMMTDMSGILACEGLPALIPLFVENEIDHDAFVLMTEQNLRELGVTDAVALARLTNVIALKRQQTALTSSSTSSSLTSSTLSAWNSGS